MSVTIKKISLHAIDRMDGNPNRLDPEKAEDLRASIREHGFLQPILVYPSEAGRFILVDGEHRIDAAADCGMKEVHAVIAPDAEKAARLLRISLNNLRGELDLVAVARELTMVHDEFTIDEMLVTGFDESEINKLLTLSSSGVPELALADVDAPADEFDRAKKYHLSVSFDSEHERTMAKAKLLEAAGEGGTLADGLRRTLGMAT